jgi:uncharacterized membrane protein YjjB (DUF3815 family)
MAAWVRMELNQRQVNYFLVVLITALVASLLAGNALWLSQTPQSALTAAVLLLVPGVPLINASVDILRGHISAGLARATTSLVVFLGIALGSGARGPVAAGPAMSGAELALSAGPKRVLGGGGDSGVRGIVQRAEVRLALLRADRRVRLRAAHRPDGGGMGMVLATLGAALLIGVLATILAERFAVSGTLFAVGPAIPLVPGSYAYKAVMGMVMAANSPELEPGGELLLAAFDNGIKAVLTILFLSFGIALPGLIWSSFRRGS